MIKNQTIEQLMQQSSVSFGTSGARGLATKMTDEICYAYTLGFIQHLQQLNNMPAIKTIAIAGDLRPSTHRIMNACAKAILDKNINVINCGTQASPAIALYGIDNNIATIMVTGSHIPDDRNGIKFNTPFGEILKTDEQGIRLQHVDTPTNLFTNDGSFSQEGSFLPEVNTDAEQAYISRFINFFPENALTNMKVGVYQHSGVARDIILQVIEQLGAEVVALGRSDTFIPVDTEAVRQEDEKLAKQWSEQHKLDAIVSTDGDADRPLVSDENGNWFRGDIVGILCSQYLQVKNIVTPVSSNTLVEKSKLFSHVARTRIGSPFVIKEMQNLLNKGYKQVAGYEANGGFLSADTLIANDKQLSALPTRDALIVILSLLHLSRIKSCRMSELMESLPQRYTHSDRIKEIPSDKSMALLNSYLDGNKNMTNETQQKFLNDFALALSDDSQITEANAIDGLRITLNSEDIIHLRPSGNAPEFRCYTESDSFENAYQLNHKVLSLIKTLLS